MGYYSDVRINVSEKGYEKLEEFYKNYLKEHGGENYSLFSYMEYFSEDNNEVYFGWDSIKWYQGDAWIDGVIYGLDYLRDNDYSFHFVRIGENYDDVEEEYFEGTNDEPVEFIKIIRKFYDPTWSKIRVNKLREKETNDIIDTILNDPNKGVRESIVNQILSQLTDWQLHAIHDDWHD